MVLPILNFSGKLVSRLCFPDAVFPGNSYVPPPIRTVAWDSPHNFFFPRTFSPGKRSLFPLSLAPALVFHFPLPLLHTSPMLLNVVVLLISLLFQIPLFPTWTSFLFSLLIPFLTRLPLKHAFSPDRLQQNPSCLCRSRLVTNPPTFKKYVCHALFKAPSIMSRIFFQTRPWLLLLGLRKCP